MLFIIIVIVSISINLNAVLAESSSVSSSFSEENVEVLPGDPCDCRDWYGMCRKQGEKWMDDATWIYECGQQNGADAPLIACRTKLGDEIKLDQNITIDGLWHNCAADNFKVKYEEEPHCITNGTDGRTGVQKVGTNFREGRFDWLCLETGRWVVGCYYKNETGQDVYLKIGETGYNGLVKHVCDRYKDYPGLVQYYAVVREDAHVKHPSNKGKNSNLPEPGEFKLAKDDIKRWLHETANIFIKNDEIRARIRYLPASRKAWQSRVPPY